MDESYGRPIQVHAVPLEERAVDSKGNKLPWGLEWHPDHPNSRGQRRHVEEKGPFGNSNRRKASSRTRTVTPAKRENLNLEGFDKALKYDLNQNAQSHQRTPGSRLQAESNTAPPQPLSTNKEPTQVTLFGYSSKSQWAALDVYEKGSYGMICEDYAREPPMNAKRYPSTFSSPRSRRPLTKVEKAMAFRYDGGEHWVKVTFDSAEAAERAIETSPAQIYGHWVYAQLYYGKGPERDEPIPVQPGESEVQQPRQKPNTIGPNFTQRGSQYHNTGATLPRSFASTTHNGAGQSHENSPSSSTATSGTATGVEHPDLRLRQTTEGQTDPQNSSEPRSPQMMRHFPGVPKTVLRPATEAFLSQPTWWERQLQKLTAMGLIPGEIIGNGMPLAEDGRPDLARASFYWRFFYWTDTIFGTDFCGLRDE